MLRRAACCCCCRAIRAWRASSGGVLIWTCTTQLGLDMLECDFPLQASIICCCSSAGDMLAMRCCSIGSGSSFTAWPTTYEAPLWRSVQLQAREANVSARIMTAKAISCSLQVPEQVILAIVHGTTCHSVHGFFWVLHGFFGFQVTVFTRGILGFSRVFSGLLRLRFFLGFYSYGFFWVFHAFFLGLARLFLGFRLQSISLRNSVQLNPSLAVKSIHDGFEDNFRLINADIPKTGSQEGLLLYFTAVLAELLSKNLEDTAGYYHEGNVQHHPGVPSLPTLGHVARAFPQTPEAPQAHPQNRGLQACLQQTSVDEEAAPPF